MIRLTRDGVGETGDEDPLEAYRDRAMYLMSVVAVVVLAPLVVHNLLLGRHAIGAAAACLVLLLALDAYAVHRRRRPPVPYIVLLLPGAVAIGISLKTQGVFGAFWCFPAVLFFYFVLRRRAANFCSFSLLVGATLAIHWWIGDEEAVRFFLALSLTIVVVNIILNIVGDLERRLLEQAITDPLTGAFNRRHMQTRLEEAIERGRRANVPASILLMDIDHFKRINDAFGHEAGDHVLKELVQLVRERLRRADLLFRMGGEEFLLLLGDTPPAAALKVAEALRSTVAQAHFPVSSPVTVSLGVSALEPIDSVDSWVKRADVALYAAKNAGRNRVIARPPVGEEAFAEPAGAVG
jgi:diguanylate cyclase (GGDEF)-like protein